MLTPLPRTAPAGSQAAVARSRRRLPGALAVGGAGALMPGAADRVKPAAAVVGTPVPGGGLAERGICYDTGTDYVPGSGFLSIQTWDPERVAREMAVLHGGLHCNAVAVFGSDPGRLREGAEIALREGLRVWVQPRPIDSDTAT